MRYERSAACSNAFRPSSNLFEDKEGGSGEEAKWWDIYLLKKKWETRKANDALVVLAGTRKESLLESTQKSIKNQVDACPHCEHFDWFVISKTHINKI